MKVVKNVISKIKLLYLYKENKFFILRNLVFQVENSFHKLESFLGRIGWRIGDGRIGRRIGEGGREGG